MILIVCFAMCAVAVLGGVILVRNEIVCRVRMRVNQECCDEAMDSVDRGEPIDINRYWSRYYKLGSYDNMVLKQWTKWNYDQFTRGL